MPGAGRNGMQPKAAPRKSARRDVKRGAGSDAREPLVERALWRLLAAREGRSICPSEVARALDAANFRPWMAAVRAVAARLQREGKLAVSQKGEAVELGAVTGPVRLSLPRAEHRARHRASRARVERPRPPASRYHGVDYRKHPELYRVGRGEQGVLSAEPYKSELLPLWRFRTPALARASVRALKRAFLDYRAAKDFVGMDLTRKFLQMGYTRARRYANHPSGRKYDVDGDLLPFREEPSKALAAQIFQRAWRQVERDPVYAAWRRRQQLDRRPG